jgi:acetyl-CoA carboxylase biotin carboxyl carrier protein
MDLDLIERLMIMLEKSTLDTLDVTENGMRIRLSKAGTVRETEQAEEVSQADRSPAGHLISAGLTGIFYRAPAPDAAPFAEVGDEIKEGQVLGLIEAMKMLNPVEADRDGMIEAILVANAQPVLPGQPLIRFAKAPDHV